MTLADLIACGVAPTQARLFIDPVSRWCPAFGIVSPVRLAAFLAECIVESGAFVKMEESFFYRDPVRLAGVFRRAFKNPSDAVPFTLGKDPKGLASRVYAGVNGNGDEASGDGWRFRGRGPFQLTGRANYLLHGQAVGRDWIAYPDEVSTPSGGVLAACSFWKACGFNAPADASDIDTISRGINPAGLALVERAQRFSECLQALR